mgnify:CR=1 FL=1
MYLTYCSDPDCRGHVKSWERCSDLKAFAAQGAGCRSCAQPADACPSCPASAVTGIATVRLLPCAVK